MMKEGKKFEAATKTFVFYVGKEVAQKLHLLLSVGSVVMQE